MIDEQLWKHDAEDLAQKRPKKILFLCVHNSARSQLAEAIARHMAPGDVTLISAGSQPTQVRPEVFQVLQEAGIASDGLYSKSLRSIDTSDVDAVITLCADNICPYFPRPIPQIHWALPDPVKSPDDESTGLDSFRRTRDELHRRLKFVFGNKKDGSMP